MTPRILEADLGRADHAAHFLALMDHFALDPMTGGKPIDPDVRARLVPALRARRDVTVLLAYDGDEAIGLATLIESFSTFAARALWNLHDMVVLDRCRGQGVGQSLLAEIERIARTRGYCKLTLEVLSGNARARAAYERAGYAGYTLGSGLGHALFLEKSLYADSLGPSGEAPPAR